MTARELDAWGRYFDENPGEADQSSRLELMLARISTGFFKGDVSDHMLYTEDQRRRIDNDRFLAELNKRATTPNG